MLNSAFFLKLLLTVVGFIVAITIVPALLRIAGLPVSDDLLLVIRLLIAVVAGAHVARGNSLSK
jgi:hypothetical protein